MVEQNKNEMASQLVSSLDSKFFKTLSEPVRVQILKCILLTGRSDIGTIARQLPQDRSVISRHLAMMQEAGLLIAEKEGRQVYYALNGPVFVEKLDNILGQIKNCISVCCPEGYCNPEDKK